MTTGSYFIRETDGGAALLPGDDARWIGADRIAWGPASYRTSFRALWSADGLYLRFDATDPRPWHTLTTRDDALWDEEVVEIFLDLDGSGTHYAEIELSPANVVTDVRMLRGSPDKEMDLSWDFEGLTSEVRPAEKGWIGCLFLPWDGFRSLPSAHEVSLPPVAGDRWRFNVYRIERPGGPKAPERDVVFASFSPTESPSFHVPASFQGFVFS